MPLRPRLLPSLITAAALALLLGLGIWQLERQAWKTALIAELEARLAAPPLSAIELSEGEAKALRYRRVAVSGTPVGGPFLWRGRTRNGEVGAHVLTLYAPDDGLALIVDRGWVPYGKDGTPEAFPAASAGVIEAVAREAGWQGFEFLRPAHQPEANAWLYVDSAAMAQAAGYQGAVNEIFYVSAVPGDHAGLPVAQVPEISLPNNHLQYAITWFAVAAGVLAIYLLWLLRQSKSPESDPQ